MLIADNRRRLAPAVEALTRGTSPRLQNPDAPNAVPACLPFLTGTGANRASKTPRPRRPTRPGNGTHTGAAKYTTSWTTGQPGSPASASEGHAGR
ncbi:hypothetical protein [Paracoccus sanguinis]|uniref:hypothetical protein n=1 Tax=Paracoccus sanguinis TaxID=1545044 RepID=UPI0014526BFE|nr:hypothetical protein [Paracoccus sanguinis]QJD17567.1 hypothetical protein HGN31_12300 [Paracoccus sanguinis]